MRSDYEFASGETRCAAWLYSPSAPGRHPCVVMGHGFSAVREQRLDEYAERFSQAGMGVLLFDYRYFGASGGEPRQLLSIRRQLQDWEAAAARDSAIAAAVGTVQRANVIYDGGLANIATITEADKRAACSANST